jgi:hypothetical protein
MAAIIECLRPTVGAFQKQDLQIVSKRKKQFLSHEHKKLK